MKLLAQKREILGKKVRKLRRQGILPAVVFGAGEPSVPLTFNRQEFEKVYGEAGESTLLDLQIDGQNPLKALVSEIDRDPVGGQIIHANLQKVSLTEKMTATVPIEITGESPIVKAGGGMILTLLDEVEVECFPQDLPARIEIDVSRLTEVDQTITIKDLPVDKSKVEILKESEELVLKIAPAQMEEEVLEEAKPIEEAIEITGEKKEEGEEGKEQEEKEGATAKKTQH